MWITIHGTESATVEIKPPDDESNVVLYDIDQVGTYEKCFIDTRYPYRCSINTGKAQARYEYQSYVLLRHGFEIRSVRRSAWTPPNRKTYTVCHFHLFFKLFFGGWSAAPLSILTTIKVFV